MHERRGLGAEHASVLVLMPTAVLIFLVLGALAVDAAAVFLAQRQLANAAVAAANDAVAAAVDVDSFYSVGQVRLLPTEAQRIADETVLRLGLDRLSEIRPVASVRGPVVEVTITARVEHIFSGAVPGGPDTALVAATAAADAARR
ncbi:MAG: hypothetical protein KY447_08985 [Actinobacteria bacterium]|nr:hypothetical protein [Actinomycetota bacterium]